MRWGAGSRVIRSTWKELEKRSLVAIEPGAASGDVPTIRALREDRSGKSYTIPTGQRGDTYRRIPELAWRMLFPSPNLTGPGLVMYLISPRTHGQANGGEMTFPRKYISTEYGISDFRRIGYGGPCPPSGTHRYYFKIYALDARVGLEPGATKDELLSAMEGHILAQGQLMGKYKRQ